MEVKFLPQRTLKHSHLPTLVTCNNSKIDSHTHALKCQPWLNVLFAILEVVMMVTACRRGGECPYFQRRRCFFGPSAEEVAAALLVGSEAPRGDVLELAAEVQGLRRVVQRLDGTIMWDRASPAATAVAKTCC